LPLTRRVPTLDDLLTMNVGRTQISPDGKWIAYTVGYVLKKRRVRTQIWLPKAVAGSFQLTQATSPLRIALVAGRPMARLSAIAAKTETKSSDQSARRRSATTNQIRNRDR
jgi:hypothetical protein